MWCLIIQFSGNRPVKEMLVTVLEPCSIWLRSLSIFHCCLSFQVTSQELLKKLIYRLQSLISLCSLLLSFSTSGKQLEAYWPTMGQCLKYHLICFASEQFLVSFHFAVFISSNFKHHLKGSPACNLGEDLPVMRNCLGSP